ncbi:MAG TPA: TRAM domain-containing protein, partial [Candidatus Udaeobacter sp.]|nr:TRAM domain-containing protein [Candidatus Udaeobacter sp.]
HSLGRSAQLKQDVNDMRLCDLKIADVAFGGKGVAREQGKAVFVPYTIEGETISAEIVREKKQFAEAELVEVKQSSPNRIAPECPYFGRCGGCAYQHIDYQHQLAIKWRQVRDALQRIGKLKHVPMRPIVASPMQYAYRNRITVHALDGMIGFFRRDSHRLINIEHCPIARDEVNSALAKLREQKHVRDGHYTLRAASEPRVFSQINDDSAEALRNLIIDLGPPNQRLLIDAYCGAGFFAKALLDKFERVIGIDWDRFAITAAKENASEKETYIAGDVESELQKVVAVHLNRAVPGNDGLAGRLRSIAPTTIIVDPPATGLTEGVRTAITDLAPDTLIYVSCNPPTLARDLKELQHRFVVNSITPLDMFPQTAEIEVLAHLEARH